MSGFPFATMTPGTHHHDAVGYAHVAGARGDEQHGRVAAERIQMGGQRGVPNAVEAVTRVIEQEDRRLLDERTGEREAAQHPLREQSGSCAANPRLYAIGQRWIRQVYADGGQRLDYVGVRCAGKANLRFAATLP